MPDRSPPQFSTTPTRFLEPNIEYDTATVYIGLSEWAKAKRDELPTRRCRNHRQLGIYLRQAIKEGKLEKRASNGKALYLLRIQEENAKANVGVNIEIAVNTLL